MILSQSCRFLGGWWELRVLRLSAPHVRCPSPWYLAEEENGVEGGVTGLQPPSGCPVGLREVDMRTRVGPRNDYNCVLCLNKKICVLILN